MKTNTLLYTAFFYLALPLIVLRLLWRSLKAPEYRRRLAERFGVLPFTLNQQPCIWLHTVSVGETIGAKPLVFSLLKRYPNHRLVITTTTPTGSAQVYKQFSDEIEQQRIVHCYIPYDLPGSIKRFLNHVKPQAALFMETEVWPNILNICGHQDIPTVLVNARLSERSMKGYQRFEWLTGKVFSSLSRIAAQDESGSQRMRQLGADNLKVTGSLKLEIHIDPSVEAQAQSLKGQWSRQGRRKIIIAASTHEGEEKIILEQCQPLLQKHPELLLLIVPRHPERFASVRTLCTQYFPTQCRSDHNEIDDATRIVVGDTMGELMLLYGLADIAIVGGSFITRGGHNMLEPAVWSLPIISGPSVFNFADIAKAMAAKNALCICDGNQLKEHLLSLLSNEKAAKDLGANAYTYVNNNKGALEKTLACIEEII